MRAVGLVSCVALCLLASAAALQMGDRATAVELRHIPRSFMEIFAHVSGTKCGNLHCPYDRAVCCPSKGGRKATCCPAGYQCTYPDSGPTTCEIRKTSLSDQESLTINPSIVISSQSGSGSGSGSGSSGGSSLGSSGSASSSPQLGGSSSLSRPGDAPPMSSSITSLGSSSSSSSESGAAQPKKTQLRQNIIIVKNINVLTKLQQVKPSIPEASPSSSSSSSSSGSSSGSSSSSAAPVSSFRSTSSVDTQSLRPVPSTASSTISSQPSSSSGSSYSSSSGASDESSELGEEIVEEVVEEEVPTEQVESTEEVESVEEAAPDQE